MTCKKCKWEFCWVCMGPWTEHGTAWYQCNRFDEKSGTDARDTQAKSRASLERYLHVSRCFYASEPLCLSPSADRPKTSPVFCMPLRQRRSSHPFYHFSLLQACSVQSVLAEPIPNSTLIVGQITNRV